MVFTKIKVKIFELLNYYIVVNNSKKQDIVNNSSLLIKNDNTTIIIFRLGCFIISLCLYCFQTFIRDSKV